MHRFTNFAQQSSVGIPGQMSRLLAIAFIGLLATSSRAADYLDTNFGLMGISELNLSSGDGISSMQTDNTGRIYLTGSTRLGTVGDEEYGIVPDFVNHYIARFHSDGTSDQSFGGFGGAPPGTVIADMQLNSGTILGVVTLDDGKLLSVSLIADGDTNQMFVSRYLENGWLDETFGNLGKKVIDMPFVGYEGNVRRVNDKLYAWCSNYIARLNLDGTLDAGFGSGGVLVANTVFGINRSIGDLAFSEGTLIVGAANRFDSGEVLLFQVDGNGNTVGSFGNGGSIDLTAHSYVMNEGVKLAVNNQMATVGISNKLIRVDFNGNLDGTFGTDGVVQLWGSGRITDIIHQPFGMTTVGFKFNLPSSDGNFGLARVLSDGSPDVDFGNTLVEGPWSGWLRLPYGNQPYVRQILGYTNGKVLAVGGYEVVPGNVRNVTLFRTEPFGYEHDGPGVGDGFEGLQGLELEDPTAGIGKLPLSLETLDPTIEWETDELMDQLLIGSE